MRIAVTVTNAAKTQSADVLVDADQELSVASLTELFLGVGVPASVVGHVDADLFVRGERVDESHSMRRAGIVEGAVFEFGGTAAVSQVGGGLLDVCVVAGPGTGRVAHLGTGRYTVGTDPTCDVVLPTDTSSSVVVAELAIDVRLRVRVRRLSSDLPVVLDGQVVSEEFTAWESVQQLLCGATLLEVRPAAEPDVALECSEDGGWLRFNRPPRFVWPPKPATFRIPAKPQPGQRNPWPWLTALLPALFGVALALLFRSIFFLGFALLSPVMMFGSSLSARRQGKRSFREQVADHERKVKEIESDVAASHVAERLALRAASPHAAELWTIAIGPYARLWERRPADADYLILRVGTADLPSAVVVEDMREDLEHRRRVAAPLRDVPATFSLRQAGVAGVAGVSIWRRRVGGWLLGQLAVMHSPQDVQLYLLTDSSSGSTWQWVAWLPHARPLLGQDARVLVGNDPETVGRRVAELVQLIADRAVEARKHGPGTRLGPDVVVLLDGARRLRAYPGIITVLRDGPEVGVHSICLDEDEQALPEECRAVVAERSEQAVVLRRQTSDVNIPVRLDETSDEWYQQVSRALAPLRDITDGEADVLPGSARLLELLELDPPTTALIRGRWRVTPRSTRAVVGVSLDGPFAIDLVRDGPHGLIAGTTGSGKSELLQTLVASLAVVNRPDGLNFVLVDYKGGAAFKDCVRLPHTVGMVTDLDAHLVERALTSLGAELTRRERLLAGAGAKDLEDYLDLIPRQPRLSSLPRLLIVIDEFASMARELPDFVTGLVNIAQRGRSLGIHLLLATQRPSGVVSAEIRANTNLRVALRVPDSADSSDVIDAQDAARIPASAPGRAYVRLGHNSLVPFQTARIGGRSPGVAVGEAAKPFAAMLTWDTAGQSQPVPSHRDNSVVNVTDLSTLVDVIGRAASELELPPQHRPWLPPLPEVVLRDDLPAVATPGPEGGPGLLLVPWALVDLPEQQSQRSVYLDFAEFGHMFVVGTARTGRSQALRTLAGGVADTLSPADVHLFGIDCGNGALLPLAALPHTGAVVQRSEKDRLVRLIDRLQEELTRRQGLLGQLGVGSITEQRAMADPADRLPHLILLLDRWESFVSSFGEVDGGVMVEQVLAFLREGAGAGLHIVLAGDRSLLSGRISVLTDDKWVLHLAEPSDYTMAGLRARSLPEHMPPGRMVRAGTGHEAQVALLSPDGSGPAQVAALATIAARVRERHARLPLACRPLKIDTLPATLAYDEAREYLTAPQDPAMYAFIGIGGDQLTGFGADLKNDAPAFLVAGPARSGRSNLLAVMGESLLEAGCELVVISPRRSALQDHFTERKGVRACLTGIGVDEATLSDLLQPDDARVVLLVDDAELLRDVPAKDYLRSYVRNASGTGRGLIMAGNVAEIGSGFASWQTDVRNYQRGALLNPRNIFDGDLVGVRLPRSMVAGPITPGRALVHLGSGDLHTVQIPRLL